MYSRYVMCCCSGVVVEVFGSTYTGFALKDSDINMNLKFNDFTDDDNSVSMSLYVCLYLDTQLSVRNFYILSQCSVFLLSN